MKKYVKMGPATILAVVAYLTPSCAATLYGADTTCDFSGLRLDNEVARVLARLPENYVPNPQELQPYVPGLELAGFSVKGLNKLRLYGPLFPYCINGSRMLYADIVNDGDIVLSLPWKACSGHEGRFSVRAMFSRFTAQFRILESSDEGVKLGLMGRIAPVTTEGLRAIVDGAGTEVRSAFQVLSALFPSLVDEVWYWQFALEFHRALRKAIE
ncbi:uncharacterized protein LOC119459559 isoform X2 [Dermacentor silvarum]|uniref:uncharacterized protein LOC119459559 isoform X2 n=1 Tax=Dermacentor silvarum TaxID=543639 RepID=UPI0021014DDE|nr:uncharacterized protein LOC119459559 isoform X2 [Dermacentor silvarum]